MPDRFLVGLAVLSVLAGAAEDRPLVCVVDDAQWLDRASAQVLAFVARRLGMESVGLVFSARVPAGDLTGLPQLVIEGLTAQDARALLDAVLTEPVDIRDVQALKSRPLLNARHTGKRGCYLPDFWKGHWRRLRVRLLADADHSAGAFTGVIRNLRVCL